jgi:hypothetical protein
VSICGDAVGCHAGARSCRAEEGLGRRRIPVLAQHRIDQMAIRVDGPIQVTPAAPDLQIVGQDDDVRWILCPVQQARPALVELLAALTAAEPVVALARALRPLRDSGGAAAHAFHSSPPPNHPSAGHYRSHSGTPTRAPREKKILSGPWTPGNISRSECPKIGKRTPRRE